MKKRAALLAATAILVLLAAVYLWGPSSVPPSQGPLVTLTSANFSEFENAFDHDADVPRLVVLLSPT